MEKDPWCQSLIHWPFYYETKYSKCIYFGILQILYPCKYGNIPSCFSFHPTFKLLVLWYSALKWDWAVLIIRKFLWKGMSVGSAQCSVDGDAPAPAARNTEALPVGLHRWSRAKAEDMRGLDSIAWRFCT